VNSKLSPWIEIILRIALGAVFIYASLDKIANPSGFATAIGYYRMLPYVLIPPMAAVLPWLELACGLALILNRWIAGASLLIVLMNAIFIIAITAALMRGLDITCGCFSTSAAGSRIGLARLVEDTIFLLAAGYLYIKQPSTSYNR
jgi:uncharacterized membrane protein YphA (DoxX/SURF4 family)